jgi:gentisate 1,2-dioxygenase
VNGGWTMPTIASWMMYLPAGTKTLPMRSTDGLIVACAEGTGTAFAGETKLHYAAKDSFIIPNWTWRHFEATEDTFLFFSSDRVVQERMGIWREQRSE